MKDKSERQLEQLGNLIALCIGNWKSGYDPEGYERFIRSLEQLEHIVDVQYDLIEDQKARLFLCLENMYQYVQNKDLFAVCDVLEYEWLPLIREWEKGCESE